jgi:hypothetical protein
MLYSEAKARLQLNFTEWKLSHSSHFDCFWYWYWYWYYWYLGMCIHGRTGEIMPFNLILRDPLGNSFVSAPLGKHLTDWLTHWLTDRWYIICSHLLKLIVTTLVALCGGHYSCTLSAANIHMLYTVYWILYAPTHPLYHKYCIRVRLSVPPSIPFYEQ